MFSSTDFQSRCKFSISQEATNWTLNCPVLSLNRRDVQTETSHLICMYIICHPENRQGGMSSSPAYNHDWPGKEDWSRRSYQQESKTPRVSNSVQFVLLSESPIPRYSKRGHSKSAECQFYVILNKVILVVCMAFPCPGTAAPKRVEKRPARTLVHTSS